MSKIGLFYASSTGNTEDAAKTIAANITGIEVVLHDVSDCLDDAMQEYDFIIIGASTWGEGELQDDWEEFLPNISNTDFSDKRVALFGLGDQEEYCDNYLDAMGTLYDAVVEQGATVVGSWSTDGYDHEESTAVRDGEFVGLALDEDNQDDLTNERIIKWIEQIAPYFSK
ncbi:MAG: flavodoxin [Campylobacterota bacterium]|nr:flavodoxin [Campylobacterota bacterium]